MSGGTALRCPGSACPGATTLAPPPSPGISQVLPLHFSFTLTEAMSQWPGLGEASQRGEPDKQDFGKQVPWECLSSCILIPRFLKTPGLGWPQTAVLGDSWSYGKVVFASSRSQLSSLCFELCTFLTLLPPF